MSGCTARRSDDLLAKLTFLHSRVEKELEAVEIAVMDLLHQQTEPSSASVAARRLLGGARNRIRDALARQRLLLWEFSVADGPIEAHTISGRGTGVSVRGHQNPTAPAVCSFHDNEKQTDNDSGVSNREDATTSCRHRPANDFKGDSRRKASREELDWKRDTLVRMQHLLRRKAEDGTANEVDTAAIRRDMAKIDAALERVRHLQHHEHNQSKATSAVASVRPRRCATAVIGRRHAAQRAQSTEQAHMVSSEMMTRADGSAKDTPVSAMEASDRTGHIRARPTSRREEIDREHGGMPVEDLANSGGGYGGRRIEGAVKSDCGGLPVREEELRLPE